VGLDLITNGIKRLGYDRFGNLFVPSLSNTTDTSFKVVVINPVTKQVKYFPYWMSGSGGGLDSTKIPLAGTAVGKPVTGDIEFTDGNLLKVRNYSNTGDNYLGLYGDGLALTVNTNVGSYTNSFQVTSGSSSVFIGSTDPSSHGITGAQDFTTNITDLDYVQKKYVDSVAGSGGITVPQLTDSLNARVLRFGIQDNLGLQDRSMDMQNFSLDLEHGGYFLFEADNIANTGYGLLYAQSSDKSGGAKAELSAAESGVGTNTIRATPNGVSFRMTDIIKTNIFKIPVNNLAPGDSAYLAVSVNGTYADSTGNITISGGGGGGGNTKFVTNGYGSIVDSSGTLYTIKADTSVTAKLRDAALNTLTDNVALKLSSSNFVFNEVPSGTINSSNVTFTLANTPTTGTVQVYVGGLRQKLTTHYSISGSTITFVTAPATGTDIIVDYLK
jgi:hypothetical protein